MSIKKGTKVELDQKMLDEAYYLGKLRSNTHPKGYKRVKGLHHITGDQEGLCGELAFAILIDASYSQFKSIKEVKVGSFKDKGDCVYRELNIDVKTSRYKTANLLVLRHKLIDSEIDAYVLMTGFYGDYTFRGYITKDQIKKEIEKDNLDLKKDVYWIPQKYLDDLP